MIPVHIVLKRFTCVEPCAEKLGDSACLEVDAYNAQLGPDGVSPADTAVN